MQQILQNPTTRLWCLSGLTGLALMVGVLLGESQARTSASSPAVPSMQANKLNLHTQPSKSIDSEKSQSLKSIWSEERENSDALKQESKKHPAKKRMGLAILFLGIGSKESH